MNYDVIVIGAGPAGYEVASLLGKGGKSVCIIEKNEIGGTCLNEGCIPAKNFLESANFVKKSEYFNTCGVDFTINKFDVKQLQEQTKCLICDLKTGITSKLKKSKVDIKFGKASFVDTQSIKINEEILKAKHIIIASGSHHRNHPLIPLLKDKIISSKEVFDIKEIPKSILIVGGGAIGCEFATFFNALSCKTDIAEFTPNLVPLEDTDISKTLKREFDKQGIKTYLSSNITSYKIIDDMVQVTITQGEKNEQKTYEKVLISIGRNPNTKDLNLANANIKEHNNFIEVNSNLNSTTNKNIYAIGDVIQTPALAHVAYYEAKRVASIILGQEVMSEKMIFPSVTFCSPQIASIGDSEKYLKKEAIKYKTKKIFFKSNAKAKIKGDDSGFIKIIYDPDTEIILGASIIGNEATELIHEFLVAINSKITLKELSKMIFAHPTLSESILD